MVGAQYRVFLDNGDSVYASSRRELVALELRREDVTAIHQGCVTVVGDKPVWWHARKFDATEIDETCEQACDYV